MRRPVAAGVVIVASLALLVAACTGEGPGEDRPQGPGGVEVLGGAGSVSVSGVVEGYGDELYFPETDQSANLAVGADLRDIRSHLAKAVGGGEVDWAAVSAIYEDGENGPAPLAVLGPADLVAIVRDAIAGEGRAAGISDNARRQIADRGIQGQMFLLGHAALDVAEARMAAGDGAGAAAAVDEAWAYVSGERDANGAPNNGLLVTGTAREEDFLLQGRVARPLEASLFQARLASQEGQDTRFQEYVGRSRAHLNTILYLSALRTARVLAGDTRAADREVHLAEAWGFFQPIRPMIEAAAPDAARLVEEAFSRDAEEEFPAALTEDVYAALNEPAVLAALDIPEAFQFASPSR
jgi:hypothetical protein